MKHRRGPKTNQCKSYKANLRRRRFLLVSLSRCWHWEVWPGGANGNVTTHKSMTSGHGNHLSRFHCWRWETSFGKCVQTHGHLPNFVAQNRQTWKVSRGAFSVRSASLLDTRSVFFCRCSLRSGALSAREQRAALELSLSVSLCLPVSLCLALYLCLSLQDDALTPVSGRIQECWWEPNLLWKRLRLAH